MTATAVQAPSPDVMSMSDAELRAGLAECAAERRRVEARAAVFAAEIERRSRRDLGHSGMAAKEGLKSGTDLIKTITGGTTREARTLVDAGTLMSAEAAVTDLGAATAAGEGFAPDCPWLRPVTTALREGVLGLEAANAIRRGLGDPSDSVGADALELAAERLVRAAATMDADRLARSARAERDDIDVAGVAAREQARHEKRYLRLVPAEDGMTRITGLMDPESAALVKGAFDRVMSPRRGGPRFTDPTEAAKAQKLVADPRTNDQLAHDAFLAMIRLAIDADPGKLFGAWEPGVRIHVALTDLQGGQGRGHIEGESAAVSIRTVERIACSQGTIQIGFDPGSGQVLDLGREHRLFTRKQRIALAARDGGCLIPGCEAPPGWCEAHHIDQYVRDHGRTDVRDGVLVCRFHHMWIHRNDYRIRRDEHGRYWLEPPPGGAIPGAPPGDPVLLRSKNPVRLAG